jgi:hypothetical protein
MAASKAAALVRRRERRRMQEDDERGRRGVRGLESERELDDKLMKC